MKEVTIRLYSYDELSDEAKKRANNDRLEGFQYPWMSEAEDTIRAVEEKFGISLLRNWEFGSYRSDYGTIDWENWTDEQRELCGNRARAFLWSRFGHLLLKPEYHYWTHDRNGKLYRAVSSDSRRYESKVFMSRVYDGTCPLTGYCLDCDALEPMAYFCFGVRWDEDLKKRVPSARDAVALRNDSVTTVEDVIRDCLDSLFSAIQRDCEWCESEECFAEDCKANEWMFEEDGRMRNY